MKRVLTSTLAAWTLLTAPTMVMLASAGPAIAQEANVRVLTVTGQGSEPTPATLARVSLGVEIQGGTAAAAQQQAAQQSSAVVDLLRDRGVDQLQTTGIRLDPQYRYDDGQSQLVGYVATNTVSFEMSAEEIGNLLDEAVTAGATRIEGITFRASDAAIAAAREVALRKAVAEAQAQASVVLGALDLSAEEIIGIQIDGANNPIPLPVYREAQVTSAAADVSTPVVSGEQTVNAMVTLQIRY